MGLLELMGATVVGECRDDSGPEVYHGLIVEKDGKRTIIWFLRDEEGNGPGYFSLQPHEVEKK